MYNDEPDYILSLGEDCFPRSFIDRYKLRPRFPVRMPFDGALHNYDAICSLIENDFCDYLDDIEYLNGDFLNRKHNICWNHEKSSDMEIFIEQNHKRINQFRSVLSEGSTVMFLLHVIRTSLDFDYAKFNAAVSKRFPDLKFKFFILNTYSALERCRSDVGNTTYLSLPWCPPTKIVEGNEVLDFIQQLYVTEFGVSYSEVLLEEFCQSLLCDYKKFLMDKNYDFVSALT